MRRKRKVIKETQHLIFSSLLKLSSFETIINITIFKYPPPPFPLWKSAPADISGLHYVMSARPGIDKSRRQQRGLEVASFAPLEVELGQDEDLPMDADGETGGDDDDDEFKIEVVSLTSSQTPNRQFEIADLGDPGLFHGWVDVQGIGVANDYCR